MTYAVSKDSAQIKQSAQSDQTFSIWASAKSDQGLHSFIEFINEKMMFAHAWDESESVRFAHVRKHLFAWRDLYIYIV